jgi:hypothetical protein
LNSDYVEKENKSGTFLLIIGELIMITTGRLTKELSECKNKLLGMKFPSISAESLAGTKVTIHDSAKGSVVLVGMALKMTGQSQLDSWLEPFVREFGKTAGVTFFEVPMIGIDFKPMALMIERGMRGGIPREKHKHVVNYYGELSRYRLALGMDDVDSGYLFLLDRAGIIRWMSRGYATREKIYEMIEMTKRLAKKL